MILAPFSLQQLGAVNLMMWAVLPDYKPNVCLATFGLLNFSMKRSQTLEHTAKWLNV
jgi:hypothetical protein